MSDANLTEQLAFEAWLIKDHTDEARKRGMMETEAEVKLVRSVNNYLVKKFRNGEYRDEEVQETWKGWQAGVKFAREEKITADKVVAFKVPALVDFTNATKVHFSRTKEGEHLTDDDLKKSLTGTIKYSLSFVSDEDYYVTDKNGVKHFPIPLFTK